MSQTENHDSGDDYAHAYDEHSFWEKVRRFALKAGRQVIEKALVLYYCLADPRTPKAAKVVIVGALGYFILPLDAIPDLIPGVGFADDLTVLAIATTTVLCYVRSEHRRRARELLENEFFKQRSVGSGSDKKRQAGPREFRSDAEREAHCLSVLGIESLSTASALKRRYRELAAKYHPDKVQHLGDEFRQMAEEKLKDINEAYAYLRERLPQKATA